MQLSNENYQISTRANEMHLGILEFDKVYYQRYNYKSLFIQKWRKENLPWLWNYISNLTNIELTHANYENSY